MEDSFPFTPLILFVWRQEGRYDTHILSPRVSSVNLVRMLSDGDVVDAEMVPAACGLRRRQRAVCRKYPVNGASQWLLVRVSQLLQDGSARSPVAGVRTTVDCRLSSVRRWTLRWSSSGTRSPHKARGPPITTRRAQLALPLRMLYLVHPLQTYFSK